MKKLICNVVTKLYYFSMIDTANGNVIDTAKVDAESEDAARLKLLPLDKGWEWRLDKVEECAWTD